jgi:plastocyanin
MGLGLQRRRDFVLINKAFPINFCNPPCKVHQLAFMLQPFFTPVPCFNYKISIMKKQILFGGLVLAVCLSVIIPAACSKNNSNDSTGITTTNIISIRNMAFSPATFTVNMGTTVTWVNDDAAAHTVTADNGSFDSGAIQPGAKFSHTFSTAGNYGYHCTIHAGMTGTVIVK